MSLEQWDEREQALIRETLRSEGWQLMAKMLEAQRASVVTQLINGQDAERLGEVTSRARGLYQGLLWAEKYWAARLKEIALSSEENAPSDDPKAVGNRYAPEANE